MIENEFLTKGGAHFGSLLLKVVCILFLISTNGDVLCQEYDQNKFGVENYDITLDIYRRESEKFRLPNVFVRINKRKEHCVKFQLSFSQDEQTALEVNSKPLCGKNVSIGRNHVDQNILKYWSHRTPQLYLLKLLIRDSEKTIFTTKLQAGIVDYRIENGELLVNNVNEDLKSLIIYDSIADGDIKTFKKNHVNTLIFNYIPSSELINVADELGVYFILDIRNLDQTKLNHDLIRIKNHPSISCFISENEHLNRSLQHYFPHIPIRKTFPKNIIIHPLKGSSLQKIRCFYQPFEIVLDCICSNEQNGLLITMRETEDFNDWKNTKLIYEVANPWAGYSETLTLVPQKNPESIFKVPCPFSQLSEYKITLVARQAFSVFSIADTVSYFENKHK